MLCAISTCDLNESEHRPVDFQMAATPSFCCHGWHTFKVATRIGKAFLVSGRRGSLDTGCLVNACNTQNLMAIHTSAVQIPSPDHAPDTKHSLDFHFGRVLMQWAFAYSMTKRWKTANADSFSVHHIFFCRAGKDCFAGVLWKFPGHVQKQGITDPTHTFSCNPETRRKAAGTHPLHLHMPEWAPCCACYKWTWSPTHIHQLTHTCLLPSYTRSSSLISWPAVFCSLDKCLIHITCCSSSGTQFLDRVI
jgi:hypothetical protein